jgi:hypothetical protein
VLDGYDRKRSAGKSPINMRLKATVHLRTVDAESEHPLEPAQQSCHSHLFLDSSIYVTRYVWHGMCD